jgi:hypothetical protein
LRRTQPTASFASLNAASLLLRLRQRRRRRQQQTGDKGTLTNLTSIGEVL